MDYQSIRQLEWINTPFNFADESRSTCLAIRFQLIAQIMLNCRIMFRTLIRELIDTRIEIVAKNVPSSVAEPLIRLYSFIFETSLNSIQLWDFTIGKQLATTAQ